MKPWELILSKPIKRPPGDRTIPKWQIGTGGENFVDIRYQVAEGMAKITINRPEVRNAFRPQTLFELAKAFDLARDNDQVGVIIFTGEGNEAFCSGGDINVRGDDGYLGDDALSKKGIGRLNVLDLQVQIRRTPKPVIAMVAGWAIGGGHVLHVVCDLTIAADNSKMENGDAPPTWSAAQTVEVYRRLWLCSVFIRTVPSDIESEALRSAVVLHIQQIYGGLPTSRRLSG